VREGRPQDFHNVVVVCNAHVHNGKFGAVGTEKFHGLRCCGIGNLSGRRIAVGDRFLERGYKLSFGVQVLLGSWCCFGSVVKRRAECVVCVGDVPDNFTVGSDGRDRAKYVVWIGEFLRGFDNGRSDRQAC